MMADAWCLFVSRLCLSVCVQRPLKKATWYESVEWGQLAFFMLVAPAVIYFSGRMQRELLKQLNVKK